MDFFLHLLFAAQLLSCKQAPVGTPLHVRLTTTVGSWASKAGTSVEAILIAPVVVNGETVLPAGTLVSGKLKSVKKVGFGIVHETAALGFDFTRLILPDGDVLSMSSRVANVENGRERVTKDGVIHGIRSTSTLTYRTSGYIRTALQWEIHAALAEWFIKTLVIQLPEPEIYYPAGVELTLTLKRPLFFDPHPESDGVPPRLALVERVNLLPLVEDLPNRAYAASNRPSDLINVLFIGSRAQISKAFVAAGWAQAHPACLRSGITNIRAVADGRGYLSAPMSSMLVNKAEPDMAWEKAFNDASKRDHIRMWKQPETWNGRDLWVAAATRDIDFAYFRPGQKMTHRVERDVDRERDKVAGDLTFTACVEAVDWLDRAGVPRVTRNATGDFMTTDGRLAMLQMNDCAMQRPTSREDDVLPLHGGKVQRFVRREILSMRNDLMRENIYYRAYEGTRWLIEAAIRRHRRHIDEFEYPAPPPVMLERAQNAGGHPAGSP